MNPILAQYIREHKDDQDKIEDTETENTEKVNETESDDVETNTKTENDSIPDNESEEVDISKMLMNLSFKIQRMNLLK